MRVRSPPRAWNEPHALPAGLNAWSLSPGPIMSAATAMKFAPRRIDRVLLIVNPASRRGDRIRRKALKAFEEAGVDCDLMQTESPGHATTLARNHAHKYDAVFTLGGDGTLMEVLGALAHQGPPIGVLAGGTANVGACGDGIVQDEGLLNACVFSPANLRDSVRILWRMIRKDFSADPCLFYKSGRDFKVETFPPMPAQADGELLADTPLSARVDPLAGCLLIPKRK